jgi:hypothetical protein
MLSLQGYSPVEQECGVLFHQLSNLTARALLANAAVARRVPTIGRKGLGHGRGAIGDGKPDPEIPVPDEVEALVETADCA